METEFGESFNEDSISKTLANFGIVLDSTCLPSGGPRCLIIVLTEVDGSEEAVLATIGSLLRSSSHNFHVLIEIRNFKVRFPSIANWLRNEPRFSVVAPGHVDESLLPNYSYALVIGSGVILGQYSILALVEALLASENAVVRVLVDHYGKSLELWRTNSLSSMLMNGNPEDLARASGSECWVGGATLGIHHYTQPPPRLYLRKGSAGRLEHTVVIRDARKDIVKADYESMIRTLRSRISRLEADVKKSSIGLRPSRGHVRFLRIFRRGLRYVLRRFRTLLQQSV